MANLQNNPDQTRTLDNEGSAIVNLIAQELEGKATTVRHLVELAIKEKVPSSNIIRTLQDMIRDNEPAMLTIICNPLLQTIKGFTHASHC